MPYWNEKKQAIVTYTQDLDCLTCSTDGRGCPVRGLIWNLRGLRLTVRECPSKTERPLDWHTRREL